MREPLPPAALPSSFLQRLDVQQALHAHDFGHLFHLARKEGGISYSKIAASCDIKPERVGTLATGRGRISSYEKIAQISDGMRIPCHYLGLLSRPWEKPGLETATPPGMPSATAAVELAGQLYESELLHHLTQQWHHLVKTDNLLGPRAALNGVTDQIRIIEELLDLTPYHAALRTGLLSLAARYAESTSWLYEDAGDLPQAHHWILRALQWAYEADDATMLAWVYFRKSQQADDAHHSIALAQTAARELDRLPVAMRAAITQQKAGGLARIGDEADAQNHYDQAQQWAVGPDVHGDARDGHGAFCTTTYLDLERARAWRLLGHRERAIDLYQQAIPRIPVVYQRDRGVALARFAAACTDTGEFEQAVAAAHDALDIARTTGTGRAVADIQALADPLRRYRALPVVQDLLHALDEDARED